MAPNPQDKGTDAHCKFHRLRRSEARVARGRRLLTVRSPESLASKGNPKATPINKLDNMNNPLRIVVSYRTLTSYIDKEQVVEITHRERGCLQRGNRFHGWLLTGFHARSKPHFTHGSNKWPHARYKPASPPSFAKLADACSKPRSPSI